MRKKSRLRRWIIAIVILLLAIAMAFYIYLRGKSRKSLGLGEQIPPTMWVGQVNLASILTNASLPQPLDVQRDDSVDLKGWDALLSKPFTIGVDWFTNPWIYGNDSTVCVLLQLSDSQSFNKWLRDQVEEYKNIEWTTLSAYKSAIITHDKVELAWNDEGRLLVVIALGGKLDASARNYFENTDSRDLSGWDKAVTNTSTGALFEVDTNLIGEENGWLKNWLTSDTYNLKWDGKRLKVNELKKDVSSKPTAVIALNNRGVTERYFWTLPPIKAFFGDRMGVKSSKLSNDYIKHLDFRYTGIDTQTRVFTSYDFDDNFNRVEIKDSLPLYVPTWYLNASIESAKAFEKVPQTGSSGEGQVFMQFERENGLIRCYNNNDLSTNQSSGNQTNTYIYLNLYKMHFESEGFPLAFPSVLTSFVKDFEFQADDSSLGIEVNFN